MLLFYSSSFPSPLLQFPSLSLNAFFIDPIPCCSLPTPRLLWLVYLIVASIRTFLRALHHRTLRSSARPRVVGTSLSTGMTMDNFCNTNLTLLANISRSMQLEIRVFSPAVKSTVESPRRMLPVFGDRDDIPGVVLLDPRYCTSPGRVTVTVGTNQPAFPHRLTSILQLEGDFTISHANHHDGRRRGKQRHTFFTSSQIFYSAEPNGVQTPVTLRETLANTVRPKRSRAGSVMSDNGLPPNLFPFKFDIPQEQRGQEMPPSFKISSVMGDPNDRISRAEDAEVSYTITALWEAYDGCDRALCVLPSYP